MSPYLAVIKDAFRAAVAAKLLYVTFGLITLFLVCLIPLSYIEYASYILRLEQVANPTELSRQLVEASLDEEPSGAQHVWSRLTSETQEVAQSVVLPETADDDQMRKIDRVGRLRMRFQREFSEMIADPDFYQPEIFAELELGSEAERLAKISREQRSEMESRRLNRLVFDALFPTQIGAADASVLQFTYAGFEIPFDWLKISHTQLDLFATTALPWFLDKLVLSIGVLVAILFTANMVPELLEPGSLNLLLSKPVSRWGLFLSKYVGACVFAFLNALVLFLGLWLILGTRLGLWNPAFLACIPIYVFVFAIYYSVSAVVGLMFRSQILSIVAACLFWLFCFTVGVVDQTYGASVRGDEPVRLVATDAHIVRFNSEMRVNLLPLEGGTWQSAFRTDGFADVPAFVRGLMPGAAMHDPVWDASKGRYLLAQQPADEIGATFSIGRRVAVADEDGEWMTQQLMTAPRFTRAVFGSSDQSLIFVTYFGKVYRIPYATIDEYLSEQATSEEDSLIEDDSSSEEAAESEVTDEEPIESVLAEESSKDDTSRYFIDVSPLLAVADGQVQLAVKDPLSDDLLAFGNQSLTRLHWNGARYEVRDEDQLVLPIESSVSAVSLAGDKALVGESDQAVYLGDFATGNVTRLSWSAPGRIVAAALDPSGEAGVLLDSRGVLWQVGWSDQSITQVSVSGQGDLKAMGADPNGSVFVIDSYSRVSQVDPVAGRQMGGKKSTLSTFQFVYVYGVHPAYWICPKPGEFYRVVTYLARLWPSDGASQEEDEEMTAETLIRDQLDQQRVDDTEGFPWLPIFNGVSFIALMLGVAIWYFERKDF